ncbi:hypothetical protein EON66_05435 [archaeon]|nr:MAG: hypothetical protein EON66_05435 [archaeon]
MQVGRSLLDPKGPYKMVPYQVQGIFAAVYFGGLLLSLPFMRLPPPGYKPTLVDRVEHEKSCRASLIRAAAKKSTRVAPVKTSLTLKQAVVKMEFIMLLFIVFGQFITGVVFLSSAADMTQYTFNKDNDTALFIVRGAPPPHARWARVPAQYTTPSP